MTLDIVVELGLHPGKELRVLGVQGFQWALPAVHVRSC